MLLGISIVALVKEGHRNDLYLFLTCVYTVVLALTSTLGRSRTIDIASNHLALVLFVTFAVYACRDLWPLATFTESPVDINEGTLLWAKISLLGLTGVVIPLVKPRVHIPIDSSQPAGISNEEQTASILSLALYSFLDPVIYLANRLAGLSYDQFPPLADYDDAHNLANKSFPILDPLLNHQKNHIFWGLMRVYRYEFASQALLMVIQVLADISTPVTLNELIKYIERSDETASVRPWVWIIALFLAPAISSVALHWREYLGTRTLVRTEGIITQLVFEHALRVRMKTESDHGGTTAVPTPDTASLAGTDGPETAKSAPASGNTSPESQTSSDGELTGKITTLVTADLGNITDARNFLSLGGSQFDFTGGFAHAYCTFVGLVVMLVGLPLPGYVARSLNTVQEEKMKKIDARVQTVTETLSALRMIKLFGWENKIKDQLQVKREEELFWSRKARVLEIVNGNVAQTELLDAFSDHEVSPGQAIEYIDFERDTIGFRDARFTWSGGNAGDSIPSKQQFSLNIEGDLRFQRGGLNMIVGPTGSGKTSLLMALLGEMHFDPLTPRSAFNLPREGGVAYAAQESWVQNETIKVKVPRGIWFLADNFARKMSSSEQHMTKRDTRKCALERDLDLFDAGDATEVGEKGLTLSGGQKARLTLARAVYSNADILLLDDVLAALDVHTSKWIADKCFTGSLMKDRTIILVV
ncbi:hypothetical protein HWV62_41236 [Athelia sp. TMB]|nr:hypothetical protein HWV62_41236 [Athelia sp. TMB]